MMAKIKPMPPTKLRVENIPADLKTFSRWAPWAAVWNEKRQKFDKVPHDARNPEVRISTAHPGRWFTFEAAVSSFKRGHGKFAGVGYCLTGAHGVVGIDLDNCFEPDGLLASWAADVVARLDSYTEISPSGKGLRILATGEVPFDWTNNKQGIEVYGGHQARFLTVTGDILQGAPADLRHVAAETFDYLTGLYAAERSKADVIDINVPEILDDFLLPDVHSLPLPDASSKFLTTGDHSGDRSGALHGAGVALYSLGFDDAEVFSILATNVHALDVALDHRRQDYDRAMLYLWREHCVKARVKATSPATTDEFDMVDLPTDSPAPLPPFQRDGKGKIEATLHNLDLALHRPDVCGCRIGFDLFKEEEMYAPAGGDTWRPLADADAVRLRRHLERAGFKPIGRELMRDAIIAASAENQFDSAKEWVDSLQWDGVQRIDRFYLDCFGVRDTPYARAVGAYTWTALAGRALDPGCKADMVPVLVGPQGIGKSASVAAMSPDLDFFAEVSLASRDDDLSRLMRGKLILELGELRGLNTQESESIKAFITRTHEKWIPKFKEFATKFPRRLLFIGTTNQYEFLADPTGNRRWLPMDATRSDREAVIRDRDQLWAEGAARWRRSGIAFEEAERLAKEEHQKYEVQDAWEDAISKWINEKDPLTDDVPGLREFLRTREVMRNALNFTDTQINRSGEMRVSGILQKLGYSRRLIRVDGRPTKVWVTTSVPTFK